MIKYRSVVNCMGALIIATLAVSCDGTARHGDEVSGKAGDDRQPIYYRSPMDPSVTSAVPAKDEMGMDYVPVFSSTDRSEVVQLSPGMIQTLGIRTVAASLAPLETELRTVGAVRFNEREVREIRVRAEGFVDDLRVRSEGEFVSRGQLLFQLYSPRLEVAEQEYLSSIEFSDEARIALAERRLLDLGVEPSFIKHLNQTRKMARLVPFHAPQSGIVVDLRVRQGALVSPEAPAMSLASTDPIWVIAQVPQSKIGRVKQGDSATVVIEGNAGYRFAGIITYVSPVADAVTRSIPIRLSVENPDGLLRANMYAIVHIHSKTEKPVLQVPRDSVVRYGSGSRVMVQLPDGYFEQRLVQIGDEADDTVEVLAGLNAGDRVVASTVFLIDAETSIRTGLSRFEAATGVPVPSPPSQATGSNGQR